jgi:hypothetical protein
MEEPNSAIDGALNEYALSIAREIPSLSVWREFPIYGRIEIGPILSRGYVAVVRTLVCTLTRARTPRIKRDRAILQVITRRVTLDKGSAPLRYCIEKEGHQQY